MTNFYTVDRGRSYVAGQVISLIRPTDVRPPELQRHVDSLFPKGVSAHGERYLLRNAAGNVSDPASELHFEYVRRSLFPMRPSRFTSIFATRSLEEAIEFRRRFGESNDPVWEVEAQAGFVGNMSLLGGGNSILVQSWLANEYWAGSAGPVSTQFWEVLLSPPVRLVRRVAE